MKHSFFDLPHSRQWAYSIVITVVGLVLILSSVFICMYYQQVWLLLFLIPLYFVFAQLLDIPFGHLRGTLIHYSPMLVVQPLGQTLHLHTTTLFDQIFTLPHKKPSLTNQQQTLLWILDGFLALIDKLEKDQVSTTLVGTTYFLSPRRAKLLGFSVQKADPFSKLILILNYLNLLFSMSITKGRLSFPKINNVQRFEISSQELINNRHLFSDWQEKLLARHQQV